MSGERWLSVAGYDGRYEVSDHGRVRGLPRKFQPGGRILKARPHRDGYVTAVLYDDAGRPRQHFVHRLVAAAFLPAAPADMQDVNHKDGTKSNNHLRNLEWSNDSLNVTHAIKVLGAKPPPGNRHWLGKTGAENPRSKPVVRTSLDGATQRFAGISDAARACDLSIQHISACCLGKRKQHGGFQWRFEERTMESKPIRQGDVLLTPVSALPSGCTPEPNQDKKIVLAWGEVTGHHHRIEDHIDVPTQQGNTVDERPGAADEIAGAAIARAQSKAKLWRAENGERFLEVKETVTLKHEEHTAHTLPPGIYKLPTQVEYTPAELRRVAD